MSKVTSIVSDAFVVSRKSKGESGPMYMTHQLEHMVCSNTLRRENLLSPALAVQIFEKLMKDADAAPAMFHLQLGRRVDNDLLRHLRRDELIRSANLTPEQVALIKSS